MHVPSFERYLDQIQALVGLGKAKNEGVGRCNIFFSFVFIKNNFIFVLQRKKFI